MYDFKNKQIPANSAHTCLFVQPRHPPVFLSYLTYAFGVLTSFLHLWKCWQPYSVTPSLHACACGQDSDTWINIITAMIMKQQFPPDPMLLSGNWSVYRHKCMCVSVRAGKCGCNCLDRTHACVDRWEAVFGQLTVECDK